MARPLTTAPTGEASSNTTNNRTRALGHNQVAVLAALKREPQGRMEIFRTLRARGWQGTPETLERTLGSLIVRRLVDCTDIDVYVLAGGL